MANCGTWVSSVEEIRYGEPVPAGMFDMTIPPGAKVIDKTAN